MTDTCENVTNGTARNKIENAAISSAIVGCSVASVVGVVAAGTSATGESLDTQVVRSGFPQCAFGISEE